MRPFVAFWCVLIGVVLLTGNSFAQEKEKKESYKSLKLRSTRTNTEQLLDEAEELKNNNPDDALDKVQEALAMSLAQRDAFNEARSYILLAEINEGILEWKLARENYLRAYEKLSAFTSTEAYQKTLKGLGNTNLKLGNFQESLKYYEQLLSLPISDTEKANCQIDVSEVYYQMGNYAEAMQVLESIRSTSKIAQSSLETRIQNQKAKIYARMNEFDKTQDIYSNSLNTLRSGRKAEPEELQSVQKAKEEIADVLQEQQRYDEEIDLRKQAIEYNLESNNLAEVTKDKVAISKTLEAKGETSAAIREAEEAARIADTLDNPKEQANVFLALADLYEKNGRPSQALSAYKKYSEAVAKSEKQNETRLTEISDIIKKQKDIEELSKNVSISQREETIEQATVFRQQLIIYGLVAIIVIIGVTSYFIYKNAQASKVANQMLALKSLRSQMNPHFIFNALNSVNHFIAQQDERTANRFLSEFALLMRLVLENSQEDFIPLNKEQEILSLYLKLEHYRFRDRFDYEIKIDNTINTETVEVPPMLIQPYIENAVWHGLRYKDTKGKLMLSFYRQNGDIVVEITDDGIGRKRSAELKTENQKKHNSTGLKNIEERIAIINKVYKTHYRVSIDNLNDETGTCVNIYLPVSSKNS